MITGLFVRHYKIYQGLSFIPICSDYQNKYTMFVGNNGVGKSSVLEALNTYFNDAQWNKNKNGKKDEAFIAPLFLIGKNNFNEKISDSSIINFVQFLSSYFWNATSEINPNLNSDEYKLFFEYRDKLKANYKEDYYLFLAGIEHEARNKVFFGTFHKDILNKIPEELGNFNIDGLLDTIRQYYTYIYIPVEETTANILKIENREMQELMDKNILEEIDAILNERKFEEGRKRISVIDHINNSLNKYMDDINEIIGKIDEEYVFKVQGKKKNLTSTDVRKKILDAYFLIRTLKKDNKEIYELSSGEQRIALIDIATAFLLGSKNTEKNIILAIDEPENSLHISKAFGQFERLRKLAENNQIILTTHWYGSLPITDVGNLNYLELNKKVKVHSYELDKYFENRGSLPDDITLKSYFELTSSILSSMRADKTNWIICEGSDDKLYLEHYLKDVNNLKIFAVGGCGNVVKLFKYMFVPFSEKEEDKKIESKVLCLIDTDDVLNVLDTNSETKSGKLRIARIQINRDGNVELCKLSKNGYYSPTEIEDCLNPQVLYEAISKTINEIGTMEQRDALGNFSFNSEVKNARVKGENSIFKLEKLEGLDTKQLIYSFTDDHRNKYLIAKNYVEIEKKKVRDIPPLFRLIKEFFD